jgi:hypothetical protein
MDERDVKTSLLIIHIGHLMQQNLIMLLRKRSVMFPCQFELKALHARKKIV